MILESPLLKNLFAIKDCLFIELLYILKSTSTEMVIYLWWFQIIYFLIK